MDLLFTRSYFKNCNHFANQAGNLGTASVSVMAAEESQALDPLVLLIPTQATMTIAWHWLNDGTKYGLISKIPSLRSHGTKQFFAGYLDSTERTYSEGTALEKVAPIILISKA